MNSSTPAKRVCIVAIGGASSSGKTTLAKHLRRILPASTLIVHQDDCTPPADQIPIHPEYDVADWDDPKGCMDWPQYRRVLAYIRATGQLPKGHSSRDHLNEQLPVPISTELSSRWRQHFANSDKDVQWCLVDGFLAFWDDEAAHQYDLKLLVRSPRAVLKQRREARSGYALSSEAHGCDAEEGDREFWQDPPGYFDNIVWPAYVAAHASLFVGGDVESGEPVDASLHVIDGSPMDVMVQRACECIARL